jgi:hypothetical protein
MIWEQKCSSDDGQIVYDIHTSLVPQSLDMEATMESSPLPQQEILGASRHSDDLGLMDLGELDSQLEIFESSSLATPVDPAHRSHTIIVESPDASFSVNYQSEIGPHSRKSLFSSIIQYVGAPLMMRD